MQKNYDVYLVNEVKKIEETVNKLHRRVERQVTNLVKKT